MIPLRSLVGRTAASTVAALPWMLLLLLLPAVADARSCRPGLIPNGSVDRCSTCHLSSGGGGARTPFGQAVRPLVTRGRCGEFWGPELAALDSDGDGRTNGEELQDPEGLWRDGDPDPGDRADVTNPGRVNDFGAAEISVAPLTLAFGEVELADSRTLNVEVHSAGELDLRLTSIRIEGSSPAEFTRSVVSLPAVLGSDETMTIEVTYTPADEEADQAVLRIEHDGENEPSPIEVMLLASTPSPPERIFRRGDVNTDERTDIGDAIRLLNFLFSGGVVLGCLDAADENDSGSIDLGDAIYGLNWLFRGGPAPPSPGPSDCGPDLTEDDLVCEFYPGCA